MTPRSRTLQDGETYISPTRTDKSLKFCFKSGDWKIIKSVLESLIFDNPHSNIRNTHVDGEIPKASNSKFFKNRFFLEINT